MRLALVATSHSPLLNEADLARRSRPSWRTFDHARRFVADFDPDVVVAFWPDHYNGFFYRLMPPILRRLYRREHR